MDVIFTDLDGTLLDHDTYSWEPARLALEHLRRHRVPVIFVTSKTRAEVAGLRTKLELNHPFIVENGGAAFLPAGYFPFPIEGGKRRGDFDVLEWGVAYPDLVYDLRQASQESECPVRGFSAMTVAEVASVCNMPLEEAALAKVREYDEPFLVLDPERANALVASIGARGRRWTRGGRFWHILGENDKACAVQSLVELFERLGAPVRSIGLGDGLNDASFLNRVSIPVLIRSPHIDELKRLVPHGVISARPGPEGWNTEVMALMPHLDRGIL
jgi:mannosyl-3-phosphoglycerate phosphatase